MPILIPIYIAIIFLASFTLYEVFDTSKKGKRIRKNLKKTIDNGDKLEFFDIFRGSGLLLLLAGGAGLLSWSVSRVDNYGVVLYGSSLILTILLSGLLSKFGKKNPNYIILKETVNIFTFFILGTFLLSITNLFYIQDGSYIMGLSETLGLWVLLSSIYNYKIKSSILKFLNFGLTLIWLVPYFFTNVNILGYLGYEIPLYNSLQTFFVLPLVLYTINSLAYGKHQNSGDLEKGGKSRTDYLLTGLNTILILGGILLFSYNNFYFNLTERIGFERLDILFAGTTAWLFIVDYISKKTIKNYNLNFMAPILVIVSAITSFAINFSNPFSAFILISVSFLLYTMADYLRSGNPISQIAFYSAMSTHLVITALGNDISTFYILIVDFLILIYSAIIHKTNKLFVYYVAVSIPFITIIRLFSFGQNAFISILVTGLAFCIFSILLKSDD